MADERRAYDLLVEAVGKSSEVQDRYVIAGHLDAGGASLYLCASDSKHPAIIVPLVASHATAARLTGGLCIFSAPKVEFDLHGVVTRGACAVIECRDIELLRTFSIFAANLAAHLAGCSVSTWDEIGAYFDSWERLLLQRRSLSEEAQIGLWGELWLIDQSSMADDLIAGWRGPDGDTVDFFLGGTGAEVKTTRRQNVHFVSLDQVHADDGSASFFLVSLHVKIDPIAGVSLGELVERVGGRALSPSSFEKRLLACGFSRADAVAYGKRFALVSPPLVYRGSDVPTLRDVDPRISRIRYVVEMEPSAAVGDDDARAFWNTFGISV